MKKTHFKIGLLTACLISVSSVASAQSCGAESCDSGSCKCSKKHCNDQGLLEAINTTASNFEARLASLIPDRDQLGVKAKSPCGCPKCSGVASHPVPKHSPNTAPHITPPVAQPDAVHSHKAPPNPIVDPVPVPAPKTTTPESVPLPDSRVNPFKDDPSTTRNMRAIPSRPASYLRSNERVQVDYDPQANKPAGMRSVLVSKAATQNISDASSGLAKASSTRRVQSSISDLTPEQPSVFEQVPPEVIPASISVPVTRLRPLSTIPPASDQFINPLRAH